MKVGDGKGIKTWNDLNKLKELKKQNCNFKSNIKALKKTFIQENYNDEWYDNWEPGYNSLRISIRKIPTRYPLLYSMEFISCTMNIILIWHNILDVNNGKAFIL